MSCVQQPTDKFLCLLSLCSWRSVPRTGTVEEVYVALKTIVRHSEEAYASSEEAMLPDSSRADPDDFFVWNVRQAKAISTAIRTAFGIDFDPEVVIAAANTRTLADNIVQAKALLSLG